MKIHLIGIAGAGMHSLAYYLSESGETLSGSDCAISPENIEFWKKRNVTVFTEQNEVHTREADRVIYSAAVPPFNPERAAAEAQHKACSRGEALAHIANQHQSIAVCGTHGKGTTACAIADVLRGNHIPTSDILGACPMEREQPAFFDPQAQFLVCEVDESDKTHLFHKPALLLINNVESDHLNTYHSLDDIVDSFEQLVRSVLANGGKVVLHYSGEGAPKLFQKLADCPQIYTVAPENVLPFPTVAYHIDAPNRDGKCALTLCSCGGEIVRILPALGGAANAQNLAAAAAVCLALDVDVSLEKSAPVLARYKGLKDRCEVRKMGERWLVTDYASHPTCVANDMAWLKPRAKRLVALYHPFRYSLMAHHWEALCKALAAADDVLILPLDSGGESPIDGISSGEMAENINKLGGHARAFGGLDECCNEIRESLQPGEWIVVFSGGSVFDRVRKTLTDGTPS